jgi:hypothetical protein
VAARDSGADEVISWLSNGYETSVGKWFEKGEELSMSEWQKIAGPGVERPNARRASTSAGLRLRTQRQQAGATLR